MTPPIAASGPADSHAGKAPADGLHRGAPSSAGVDADAISRFLDDVRSAELDLHSLMIHRHGRVVFEACRWPYSPGRPRLMHSLTKSVTACAIGMLVDSGQIALSDKVVSFFPEHLPPNVSDKLAAMTVEDLLTMRTGHASETGGPLWRGIDSSWIEEFFRIPVTYQPGTAYVYTSAASYMLSAIVTKLTGQTLHEYLKPRLLEPLGISGERWDIGPDGINPGGNGLTCTRADALKIGVLHAQKGMWDGRRILSEAWIEAATRAHTPGYGYHWVTNWDGAYSAVGMFVQMVTVFPHQGATLAITAAIPGSEKLTPLMAKYFPQAFRDAAFDGAAADARLAARLPAFEQSEALTSSPLGDYGRLAGARFSVAENPQDVRSIAFDLHVDRIVFRLTDAEGEHRVQVGRDRWIEAPTDVPGRDLHHGYRLKDTPVLAGARWRDSDTLEMQWIFLETAFRDTVICRFEGDRLRLDRSVNVNSGALTHPTLLGERLNGGA
jgi:CubicO group peptidase (beta-lactamase class C family)